MGDSVGLLPEDYILFMAKKSGGTNGVYLKNFVQFHRLKGSHKQVCGAVYASLANMKELHLCYAFLMLAYDGPTSSKSPTLDFIKPVEVVNWSKNVTQEQTIQRQKAESLLQHLQEILADMPASNMLTRIVARFHIDVILVLLGETKMAAYLKGLQEVVSKKQKSVTGVATARAEASLVMNQPVPIASDSASPPASAPVSAAALANQTLSVSYSLACQSALLEAEPQRKTLDAAAFWFLEMLKKQFPQAVDVASCWDRCIKQMGCLKTETKKPSEDQNSNTVAMAEISPDGKVQDQENTYVCTYVPAYVRRYVRTYVRTSYVRVYVRTCVA